MPQGASRRLVRGITTAFRGVALQTGQFTVFRTVVAGRNPTDPSRSRLYAGRWHDPGRFLAIYTSEDVRTSVAEMRVHLRAGKYVLEVFKLDVYVLGLLDLTDRAIAGRLPFPLQRCLAPSQAALLRGAAVGAAAFAVGAAAIRSPCVRANKTCTCLFFDLNEQSLNDIHNVTLLDTRPIVVR